MTGMVLYTVAAIVLYLFSDWLLNQIEYRRGARLEHRSLIFFAIIMVLALTTFSLIERLATPPDNSINQQDGINQPQNAPIQTTE